LWLAPEAPVAPLSGGRERAAQMLGYLAQRHEVHLLTCATATEAAAVAQLPLVATVLPYAQGRRAPQQRRFLRRKVAHVVRAWQPQVIHVQGAALWFAVPLGFRGRRVLEYHDAPAAAPRPWARLRLGLQVAAGLGPDSVIAVAAADRTRLQRWWPQAGVHVVENGVDLARWGAVDGKPEPATLLFPAALHWGPNATAAQVLLADVWPRVQREVADARLIIAGRKPDPDLVATVTKTPGVTLVADPPQMEPYFVRATAVVVPVAGVTGTRLKILQALAAGRAVVSTPDGAAGLGLAAGRHLLVAPLVAPFAAAACVALQNEEMRRRLVRAGREVVAGYAWERQLVALDEVYG
jgi:glycosyltransferase involved in cell wall biosynthesis